jgi:hypothetical protein
MNTDSFIGVYDSAASADFCTRAIERFEHMCEINQTFAQSSIRKNSDTRTVVDWAPHHNQYYYDRDLCQEFYDVLATNYNRYRDQYQMLEEISPHSAKGMMLQRTDPRGGYHIWHVENMGRSSADRVLAYMLYLNDVDEGGETEYLYQGLRVEPRQGRLVIWPAAWTHPHRGNPIYQGHKYIITGWMTYDQ